MCSSVATRATDAVHRTAAKTAENFTSEDVFVLNRLEMCGLALVSIQPLLTLLECLHINKRHKGIFNHSILEPVLAQVAAVLEGL